MPGQSSPARRGDEQAEVPKVTLLLRKGTDSKRHRMPSSQPLRYVFQAYCRRLGLQASQVRFFIGELTAPLISPSDTPDLVGLKDGDVLVAEEVLKEDAEEEDEDFDEIDGTRSRFHAGFLPMRMCQWYLARIAGSGGVHVRPRTTVLVVEDLDDIHGYSYFSVCLYWTCSGLRANMVEEYVLLSASSLVSRGLRLWKLPRLSSTTAVACSCLVLLVLCIRSLFHLVVDRPKMLGIVAGMDHKDSYASGVWPRSSTTMAVA